VSDRSGSADLYIRTGQHGDYASPATVIEETQKDCFLTVY